MKYFIISLMSLMSLNVYAQDCTCKKVHKKPIVKQSCPSSKKNTIAVVGGIGPNDKLTFEANGVKLNSVGVIGLQYTREVTETFTVGAQALTNRTLLGVVGVKF